MHVFRGAGFDVTFASPVGGVAPCDEGSIEAFKDDDICKAFLNSAEDSELLRTTAAVHTLDPTSFKMVFVAGGHGPMWDVAYNDKVAAFISAAYEAGAGIGAVCHGTCGLLGVKVGGEAFVAGKRVTAFTNSEEEAVSLTDQMPFALETKLKEEGAEFVPADNWAENVVVDGRVVTGQNPASATKTAEKLVEAMGDGK